MICVFCKGDPCRCSDHRSYSTHYSVPMQEFQVGYTAQVQIAALESELRRLRLVEESASKVIEHRLIKDTLADTMGTLAFSPATPGSLWTLLDDMRKALAALPKAPAGESGGVMPAREFVLRGGTAHCPSFIHEGQAQLRDGEEIRVREVQAWDAGEKEKAT